MADRNLTADGIEASRIGRTGMVRSKLDAIAALQGPLLDAMRRRDMPTVARLRAEIAGIRAAADRTAPKTNRQRRYAGQPYSVKVWK